MGTLSPAEFHILELYIRAGSSFGVISGYSDKYNKIPQSDKDTSRKRTKQLIYGLY